MGLAEGVIESLVRSIRIPARILYLDVCSPAWLRDRIDARAAEWGLEVIRIDEPLWPSQARRRIVGLLETNTPCSWTTTSGSSPGWLERLIECAEQTGAGIVGPLYLWGADEHTDRIHMAGGELRSTKEENGLVVGERHRHLGKKLDEVELTRERCDFVEFHCMLMRREIYQAPDIFNETIVCVNEHIHAALTCREWVMRSTRNLRHASYISRLRPICFPISSCSAGAGPWKQARAVSRRSRSGGRGRR
jgi:hypothetical protein